MLKELRPVVLRMMKVIQRHIAKPADMSLPEYIERIYFLNGYEALINPKLATDGIKISHYKKHGTPVVEWTKGKYRIKETTVPIYRTKVWLVNDMPHRLYGPAYITAHYRDTGERSAFTVKYLINNTLHREDGPAQIKYDRATIDATNFIKGAKVSTTKLDTYDIPW